MSKTKDVYVEKDTKQVSKHFSSMRYSKTKLTDAIKNSMIFDPLGHWKLINKALQLKENNMQISITFNFALIREGLSNSTTSFLDESKSTWVDINNPTDAELTKAIKDETTKGLQDDTRVSTFEITTDQYGS